VSEAKSPSFGRVFSTTVKVFFAIILLGVVLFVAINLTCVGLYGVGSRVVESAKKVEKTTLKQEAPIRKEKGCNEEIPEHWTDEQVANYWRWCD